jgi:biopolymer transport protein ExbB
MRIFAKQTLLSLAAASSILLSGATFAADDENKAASLDQLLDMMKQSQVRESRDHQQREAEFAKEKGQRASLLAEAEKLQAQQEARSAALEADYAKQDLQLKSLRQQLDSSLGSLKELFGHMKTASGDLQSNLKNSLVSLQIPGRDQFAVDLSKKMDSETNLPSIEEIERLVYEIQRETFEAGKVVSFTAKVKQGDGQQNEQTVVRIGNYGVVSDQYLFFNPGLDFLDLPNMQPEGIPSPAALASATSGFTQVGIDPTVPLGGQIMQIIVDRPDFRTRLDQGGLVGWIIVIVLGGLGAAIGIWRFFALSMIEGKVKKQLKASRANTNNPLGRVLKVAEDHPNVDGETLELKLEEAVLKERPSIESGLNMVKVISMLAPLMGLLGTVQGMIQTFQAITDFGAGDPKLMAGGISTALVTTVEGLVVAIPTVFLHTILTGKAKRIVHILDEQSAGIIAEKAESKK